MNLLVGATGFIGGHVVEYLFQQGEISKGTFRMGSHLKIMDTSGVQGIEADLLDHHSLHEAMEGVDVVYSMASPMPGADSDFMKFNTVGILNLLEAAKESNSKAFVHLSTLDLYGLRPRLVDPSTPLAPSDDYQKSKAESERLLQEFSKRNSAPKVAIVRAARAVGSRDGSLAVPLLRMISSGRAVIPSGGAMSFSHPLDIAQGMFCAANGNVPTGSVFLLKSFDSTPHELAEQLVRSLGTNAQVKKEGLFASSKLPKYTAEQLRGSPRIDPQDNLTELGYSPKFDLKGSCEEIAAWAKREPWAVEEG